MKAHLLKIIILSVLLASCTKTKTVYVDRPIEVVDTSNVKTIRDTIYIDRALMTDECLEYKLMVLNVRHYIEITERNKNNQKFFYGWIKRAVEEQ